MFLSIPSIDPYNLGFGEACLISLICILIVFGMLAILWGIVSLFKFIPAGKKKEELPAVKKAVVSKPTLKLEDIKDEDMMVAALVATIEYHNETKKDVHVVSIKEI